MIKMMCGRTLLLFLFLLQNFKGSNQKESTSAEMVLQKLDHLEEQLEKSCAYVKTLEQDRPDIQGFQKRLEKTEDEVREVQRNVEKAQQDLHDLENKHAEEEQETDRELRSLEARIDELEDSSRQFNRITNRLDNLEQLIEYIDRKLQSLPDKDTEVVSFGLHSPSYPNSTFVYFSAYTTKQIKNYEGYIGYDVVEADYGSGFNKYTGLFTAPVDGLYLFSFSAEVGDDSLVALRVNDDGVVRTLSTDQIGSDESIDKQLKIVTTVKLKRGDRVGCYTFDRFEIRGNSNYGWDFDAVIVKLTLFQGYLLRAL